MLREFCPFFIVGAMLFEIWLLIQTAELFIAPNSISRWTQRKFQRTVENAKERCLKQLEISLAYFECNRNSYCELTKS